MLIRPNFQVAFIFFFYLTMQSFVPKSVPCLDQNFGQSAKSGGAEAASSRLIRVISCQLINFFEFDAHLQILNCPSLTQEKGN